MCGEGGLSTCVCCVHFPIFSFPFSFIGPGSRFLDLSHEDLQRMGIAHKQHRSTILHNLQLLRDYEQTRCLNCSEEGRFVLYLWLCSLDTLRTCKVFNMHTYTHTHPPTHTHTHTHTHIHTHTHTHTHHTHTHTHTHTHAHTHTHTHTHTNIVLFLLFQKTTLHFYEHSIGACTFLY